MPVVIIEDLVDEFSWYRIEETYSLVEDIETLTRRLTLYDDGKTKDEVFGEEILFRGRYDTVVLTDSPDDDGTVPWERIERRQPNPPSLQTGSLDRERIYLDNGVVIEFLRDLEGGLSTKTTHDHPVFTAGAAEVLPQFMNIPFSSDQFDEGVHDWSSIHVFYDEFEEVSEITTIFDNGIFQSERFDSGVLLSASRSDWSFVWLDVDLQDWLQITEEFDVSGEITERVTQLDNGVEETEIFVDGVRTRLVKEDNLSPTNPPDAWDWETIVLDYDAAGELTNRLTEYDDGATRLEEYIDGVRTLVRRTDDTESPNGSNNWQVIENLFDPVTGLVTYRLYQYDDGTSLELFYEGGQLTRRLQTDGRGGDTAQNWTFIETLYQSGQITQRTTDYDDGDQRVETFEDGRLVAIVDSSAAYLGAAPTICTFTEDCVDSPLGLRAGIDQRETILGADGQVEVRKTLYSNDDQTAALYENGRIIEQHQYDGDGDQAWLARILFYSDGSVIDRLNFFVEDELPDEFAISIPSDSVPVADDSTTEVPDQGAFDAPDLSEFDSGSALVSAPEPDAFDFA